MNTEQYKKEIQRTWQTDGLTDREQICNATLGLVGEVGEYLDHKNIDELGDAFFYVYTLARLLGAGTENLPHHTHSGTALARQSAAIAEHVKKLLFHGPESRRHDATTWAVRYMISNLRHESRQMSCPSVVMAINIKNLRRRYPDGFSPTYMDKK